MRYVMTILLLLSLSTAFARGHKNEDEETGWNDISQSDRNNIPVLPDIDDFASQKYYNENQADSYSSRDDGNFRLYNPHFDDNYNSMDDDHRKVTN